MNSSVSGVLEKLGRCRRIGSTGIEVSRGWDESIDRQRGVFEAEWGPVDSWDEVILQGPHINVGTPIFKIPNRTMLNQNDWSEVDLEGISKDYLPVTSYKPAISKREYDSRFSNWRGGEGEGVLARQYYRGVWRNMADNGGERTLRSALVPPGAAHIDGVTSAGYVDDNIRLVSFSAVAASLVADFAVRVAPKSTINFSTLRRIPYDDFGALYPDLALRVLRLNCVTRAYSELWESLFINLEGAGPWAGGFAYSSRKDLDSHGGARWGSETPLRVAADRRQALVEIDAIVALTLGLTADELCTIYRTQFPVLYGYDRNKYLYDMNGRLVPQEVLVRWRKKGNDLTEEERTATNASGNTYTYELPFQFLDREADMREAYAEFERRLAAQGGD